MNLIWDYWSGDGFRLPVYLGAGYMSLSGSAENKVDNAPWTPKRTGKINSPTVLLGIGPSFNIGKFRAMGYFLASMPLSKGTGSIYEYDEWRGEVQNRRDFDLLGGEEYMVTIMGIELTYRPWGLGFTYVPPIESETAYSLKWTRRWGRKSTDSVQPKASK